MYKQICACAQGCIRVLLPRDEVRRPIENCLPE
jgi:hypothetical protein